MNTYLEIDAPTDAGALKLAELSPDLPRVTWGNSELVFSVGRTYCVILRIASKTKRDIRRA